MLCTANIRKIHLKLPGDKPWSPEAPLSERTCDNFLVFAQHLYDDEHYQILAIISPDAHQRVDAMLPRLVKLAEENFIELSPEELARLKPMTPEPAAIGGFCIFTLFRFRYEVSFRASVGPVAC
ncbi:type II toxin-antitoxin system YafO family toxin [Escherichia coli]|nr:type II toxin-antitoxin system YafO family toxin [Escherichia coli]